MQLNTSFSSKSLRAFAAGTGLLALLTVTACAPGNSATATQPDRPEIRQALESVVRAGFPGAQAVITTASGEQTITAGVGDIGTGAPIPDKAHVRIGSNTKSFVATVVMQLVAEGKVDLDGPVERYLPGVVHGSGNDGNRITVRQLLQHTSGLPDYLAGGDPSLRAEPGTQQIEPDPEVIRLRHYSPAELVRIAMTMPPRHEPGAESIYTNTNYIVLGMLIEQVTGRPAASEISSRIIEPLGLRDTYFPASGETGLRTPHPRGYQQIDGARVDFTDFDPSWGDTAGAMIATGSDLNRFFLALLRGDLLPAAQLEQMRRTVPFNRMPSAGYGLGLVEQTTSCGRKTVAHGGSIPGFDTRTGVTADGVAITITVNELPSNEDQAAVVEKAFDSVACAS